MIKLKDLFEWKEHGTVWKTSSGKIAAKNRRGRVKYFKNVPDARAWARSGSTRSSENVIPEEQDEVKEIPPMGNFPPSNDPPKEDNVPTQDFQDFS